jgi:hypothetical protein
MVNQSIGFYDPLCNYKNSTFIFTEMIIERVYIESVLMTRHTPEINGSYS